METFYRSSLSNPRAEPLATCGSLYLNSLKLRTQFLSCTNPFQVLESHPWLMAPMLDRREYIFSSQRVRLDNTFRVILYLS